VRSIALFERILQATACDDRFVALLARDARAILETALDSAGWPYSRRISLWLDGLIHLEEAGQ